MGTIQYKYIYIHTYSFSFFLYCILTTHAYDYLAMNKECCYVIKIVCIKLSIYL